MLDYVEILVKL